LETVTTRTLSFTAHGVDLYEGGFKDYGDALERRRKADLAVQERGSTAAKASKGQSQSKRESKAPSAPAQENKPGPQDHQARRAASRELERKRRRVQELEKQISELEATLGSFREELKASDGGNWERLHELALKDREYSELLERAMKEWVTLSDELSSLAEAETGAPQ
jgi:ATP-binding cassette subfamily F protein 3